MKKLFAILVAVIVMSNVFAQTNDYNLMQNWMCHPMKATDIARQKSLTLTVQKADLSTDAVISYIHPATDTGVDLFYVYPTIDMTMKSGNTEMAGIDTTRAKYIYSEQVGIYAQLGRVFVPYYKQANIGVFVDTTLSDADQVKYMEIAYQDIEAAFDNYLENYNNGNKIILMGHSQGSVLTLFLLRNRFDNNPVLSSRLVVAISGGEPNYCAKDSSRTGGTLENIKTLGSKLESGCVISWRAWKEGTAGAALDRTSFFFNPLFVDKGLIYKTYDKNIPGIHQDSNYDFGYVASGNLKPVTRYITLSADSSQYLGFDDMFSAKFLTDSTKPGCAYLMIRTNPLINDQRKIPNPTFSALLPEIPIPETSHFSGKPNNNYHCWDMQFVQGDLLILLPQLIDITQPITSVPEVSDFEDAMLIYPNPTHGIVHVSLENQKIKSIKLYNLQGAFIEEFFTNDFSVSMLTAGIYYIKVQTDKSTFTQKLVKQ
jgi:hypothetical protein